MYVVRVYFKLVYRRGYIMKSKAADYSRNWEDFQSLNVEHNPKFPRNSKEQLFINLLYLAWVFGQITKNICIYIHCTDGTLTPFQSTVFQSSLSTLLNLWPLAVIMLFVFCVAVISFFLLKQFLIVSSSYNVYVLRVLPCNSICSVHITVICILCETTCEECCSSIFN